MTDLGKLIVAEGFKKSNKSPNLVTLLVNQPQQKNRMEGGGFVMANSIFSAQSLWCLWMGKLHHFCGGQLVR